MKNSFEFKQKYDIDDLINIVSLLRAPGGCPWDAQQTHESLKKAFIEETYEVIEAVNKKNSVMLCEELGDVLLQVVFHTQLENENGSFSFSEVCDGICKKLIVRHPHIFGSVKVNGADEVLENWDEIKMQTKQQKTVSEAIDSVPKELPALMRAQKIQKKASRAGFDWENADGAVEKIAEETAEVREAFSGGNKDCCEEEIGDLLFAAVNAARFADIDAEEALTRASEKFISRFKYVEKNAAERGINMKSAGLSVLDGLWDEAKAQEKQLSAGKKR